MENVLLKSGQLLKLNEDSVISVKLGSLWITFEGNPDDVILRSGQSLHIKGKKPLAQALTPTALVVDGYQAEAC